MKKIRYRVAMSLDGYIAGPHSEADWIVSAPVVNFAKIWAPPDTLLVRRPYLRICSCKTRRGSLPGS